MSNLKIKFATTPEELTGAQRLRFEVFDLEINGGATSHNSSGLDQDEYDEACDHLIIIDTSKNMVIGTYRLLLDTVAKKNRGFYTETKFNIDHFKRLEGRLLEVGRSCVQKEYRNRIVLNLLWEAIAEYAMKNRVRYIFGSANIMTDDRNAINQYFSMFKALGLYENMGITAVHKDHAIPIDETIQIELPQKLFENLPTLFKGYMHIGLKVCGYPVEGDFKTALFPVLLDIKKVNKVYRRKFFGDYLLEEEMAFQQR